MYTYGVPQIRFEWDARKAADNKRKHKVSFEEARTVFYDDEALQIADPDHSEEEDRFVMLGMSENMRVLLVCHCYREQHDGEEVIRIISARKATRAEKQDYEEGLSE